MTEKLACADAGQLFYCRIWKWYRFMRMGWLRIDLHIPMAHSLKEKRRPLVSLKERLRRRFNVAVAEVDCHELHQRAVIGIAMVATDGICLAGQMRAVRDFVAGCHDCQVIDIREETLGWRQD